MLNKLFKGKEESAGEETVPTGESQKKKISLDIKTLVLVLVGILVVGSVGFFVGKSFSANGDQVTVEEYVPPQTGDTTQKVVPGTDIVASETLAEETPEATVYKFKYSKTQAAQDLTLLGEAFGFSKKAVKSEAGLNLVLTENPNSTTTSNIFVSSNNYGSWGYMNGEVKNEVCLPNSEEERCSFTPDQAEALVRDMLPKINGPADYDLTVADQANGFVVTVMPKYSNVDLTNQAWVFEIGFDGIISRAIGYYGVPEPIGTVEMLDVSAALSRGQTGAWVPYQASTSLPEEFTAESPLSGQTADITGEGGKIITIISAKPSTTLYLRGGEDAWIIPAWTVVNSNKNQAWKFISLSDEDFKKFSIPMPTEELKVDGPGDEGKADPSARPSSSAAPEGSVNGPASGRPAEPEKTPVEVGTPSPASASPSSN